MEKLTAPKSLAIYHAAGPTFILACDDTSLRWLASAFRALARHRAFVIGDGSPIGSDRRCLITVVVAAGGQSAAMTALAPDFHRWSLPQDEARRMAVMVDGVVAFTGPCHQYLDTGPDVPVVLVSKGEYNAAILRSMREDGWGACTVIRPSESAEAANHTIKTKV